MATVSTRYADTCAALGICLAANVPVVLWGSPGQGKTSVIAQLARDQGLRLETVIASIREPSDFAGLPVVDALHGTVGFAPPSWARAVEQAGGGVIFFDEMSTAPPSVQAAMLRVAVDRVVGDLTLPEGVRVVAAANPPEEAADGWDLAPPLANRFCHLSWSLPAEVVRDGFSFGWAPVEVPAAAAKEAGFAAARRLVGAFLGARPELTSKLPRTATGSGFAFPTPRSWEMAARLYAAAEAAGANASVRFILIAGTVGEAAAGEFTTFLGALDLPDPERLLTDPDHFPMRGRRGDIVYAVASSVFAVVRERPSPERWTACGRVLARIAEAGYADIAFATGRRWMAERPTGALPDPASLRALTPILRELGRLLDEDRR
ncbi:MAG: ATP-binding protein [Actinoplanes sp.]